MTVPLNMPHLWATTAPHTAEQSEAKSTLAHQPALPHPAHPLAIAIEEKMDAKQPEEAVRLYLHAVKDVLDTEAETPMSARECFGEKLLGRLIVACAHFACPYCSHGFSTCSACEGARQNDQQACSTCLALGAERCSFCGGAGLAGYSFFPEEIRTGIAVVRCHDATSLTKATVASFEEGSDKKTLLKLYTRLSQCHGVYDNLAQFLRDQSRELGVGLPPLADRAQRELARTELAMSRVLSALSALYSISEGNNKASELNRDKRSLLWEEAARLTASAHERVESLQGKSAAA